MSRRPHKRWRETRKNDHWRRSWQTKHRHTHSVSQRKWLDSNHWHQEPRCIWFLWLFSQSHLKRRASWELGWAMSGRRVPFLFHRNYEQCEWRVRWDGLCLLGSLQSLWLLQCPFSLSSQCTIHLCKDAFSLPLTPLISTEMEMEDDMSFKEHPSFALLLLS